MNATAHMQLRGRAIELGALTRLITASSRGRGGIAVVEGEAGIGKTRLLAEAAEHARAAGMSVAIGTSHPFETERPFAAFVEAFKLRPSSEDASAAALGRMLEQADESERPEASARYRVTEALVDLVERRTASHAQLLVLEDLHWADASTLFAVARLARACASLPLVLLLSTRPPQAGSLLAELLDRLAATGASVAHLGPLSDGDVQALASDALGAQAGEGLARLLRGASGNPLFVLELLAAMEQEHSLERAEGIVEATGRGVPPSLRLTILRRLGVLPRAVLDVLRAASVLGPMFRLDSLAAVTGLDPADVLSLLDEPLRAGFLGPADDDRIAFRHDLVRAAIYEDLPRAASVLMHRRFASALAASGAPLDQVAAHAAIGAVEGDAEAVGWLVRAARAAAPRDPVSAVERLERALEIAGSESTLRMTALPELAIAYVLAGRAQEGMDTAGEALKGMTDPHEVARVRLWLARALTSMGRITDALAQVRAVPLEGLTDRERASVYAEEAMLLVWSSQYGAARSRAEEALALAEETGEEYAAATALTALAATAAYTGDVRGLPSLVERALEHADRVGTKPLRWMTRCALAVVQMFSNEREAAEMAVREVAREAEEAGSAFLLSIAHAMLANFAVAAGRYEDALAEHEAALASAQSFDRGPGVLSWRAVFHVGLARNDMALAEHALASAQEEVRSGSDLGVNDLTRMRIAYLRANGHDADAMAVIDEQFESALAHDNMGEMLLATTDGVTVALGLGRHERAREMAAIAEDRLRSTTIDVDSYSRVRHWRAQISGDLDLMLAACESYRKSPRRFDAAGCFEQTAQMLMDAGRRDEAVALLAEAGDAFTAANAHDAAARVDAALRRAGVRRGSRASHRRARTGWDSLTESELRVVDLVAEGLSNGAIAERLFLSKRTVETHVSNVLRKLEIATRAELIASAARRRSPAP